MSDLLHLVDHSLEAMVLGTVLRSGDSAFREISFLSPDDFGVEKNRLIYRTICALAPEVNPTLEAVSVSLQDSGKIEDVGGFSGLIDLDATGIPGISLSGFAKSLRAKANDRRTWRLNTQLSKLMESGCSTAGPEIQAVIQELAKTDTGDEPAAAVRIADLPAVGESCEPIKYLREPELPTSAIVALTGESGCGKSTLATAWIRDIIAEGIPVLVLDRENPRPVIWDRMRRLGLEDGPLLRWFGGWNGDVLTPASKEVLDWVRSCEPKPLILIDSLIAFLGGDENDAAVMRGFFNPARQLADLGATVVVIHHDGKAESSRDFRGSSDFKPAIDQAFHVTNVSSDVKLDRISLRCFKSRYAFSGSLIYNYAGGQFLRDERADAPARSSSEQLTALLRQNPGLTQTDFERVATKAGIGRAITRRFLENGVLAKTITAEKGAKRAVHYSLAVGENDA